jgi:hypothetical protein
MWLWESGLHTSTEISHLGTEIDVMGYVAIAALGIFCDFFGS